VIFPLSFFNYLKEVIFPNFDLESGDIHLSRHTSSHGVAKPQEYTQERALQMILIEVSPFLKSFRFGRAIPRNYCSRSTKIWHGI
jgi:hypothetical protein